MAKILFNDNIRIKEMQVTLMMMFIWNKYKQKKLTDKLIIGKTYLRSNIDKIGNIWYAI